MHWRGLKLVCFGFLYCINLRYLNSLKPANELDFSMMHNWNSICWWDSKAFIVQESLWQALLSLRCGYSLPIKESSKSLKCVWAPSESICRVMQTIRALHVWKVKGFLFSIVAKETPQYHIVISLFLLLPSFDSVPLKSQ